MPDLATAFDGLGFFYGSRDMLDPERSAARCASFGASWACPLIESVDGRVQTRARFARAVETLRALDVRPIPYTFPTASRAELGGKLAADYCAGVGAGACVLDVEPFEGDDWTQARLDGAAQALERSDIAVAWTAFYRSRWRSLRFPPGPMLLQAYERVRDLEDLDDAIKLFGPGRETIVCIGSHKDATPATVRADVANAQTRSPKSIGVWALATTSTAEGAELKRWAVARR